ncbi:dATP pyrophosphohydrolase [Actinobacillus equuli]|nr:dATP pyrophosphohydrolase [Actinobacillus equuli]
MVLLALTQEQQPILSEHLAFKWVSVEEAIQLTKSPNNAAAIAKYLTPLFRKEGRGRFDSNVKFSYECKVILPNLP